MAGKEQSMNFQPQIVNPGNAVPFYKRLEDQWEPRVGEQFRINAHPNELLPWQVPFFNNQIQTTGDIQSVQLIGVSSGLGNTTFTVSTEWMVQLGTGDYAGQSWLTFFGYNTGRNFACGVYYFKITTAKGQEYFSEQIRVMESEWFDRESVHQLYWKDTKSHGSVFYEHGNYTQRLYFDLWGCFDHPETVNAREVVLNGQGQEIALNNLNQYRTNIDIPFMIDPWLYVFPQIYDHPTKAIKQTATFLEWSMDQYEFEPTNNRFHSQGRISFINEQFFKACLQSKSYVDAPISA